jgi:hypothetical protein
MSFHSMGFFEIRIWDSSGEGNGEVELLSLHSACLSRMSPSDDSNLTVCESPFATKAFIARTFEYVNSKSKLPGAGRC